jgi:hypothetical protein
MAVKLSEDAKYVSAFNKSLELRTRAAAYLKDLNKAKPDTAEWTRLKTRYDKVKAAAAKAEAERVAREKELKAADKKVADDKKKVEEDKSTKTDIERIKQEIQYAKNDSDAKAQAAAEAKLKEAYAKLKPKDTQETKSKTGTSFQLSDETNVANLLNSANVTMGPNGPMVQITVPNEKDPKTGQPTVYEGYLYLTTTGGGTGPKAIFFGTADVIRDRYQKQLIKNYGSKQAVIDKLYKAGYLKTNKEVPTSAYLSALDAAAGEYTVAQVNAYKQEGLKEFPTMDEFLAARKDTGGLGGTRTRTNITEFSDTAATKIINAISQQFYGRDANGKELKKLIPLINKELKKNPDVVSTTTDAEGNVVSTKTKTGLDVEQFLIDEVSGKDEAKANKVLGYYNIFKQSIGVN